MTTILRAREPRDLLSYVPYRLGFPPRESLVMVCLAAGRGRVGLVARQDLPPGWSGLGSIARLLAALAERDAAAAVFLIVYRSEPVPPHVVATLELAFRGVDIRVDDIFHLDDERYRCLTCSRPGCPREGRPLTDLQSSLVGAEMVLRGSGLVADRAALVGDLEHVRGEASADLDAELTRAGTRWTSRGRLLVRRRTEALRTWNAAVRDTLADATHALSPRAVAVLVTALQDVAVRDAVILRTVPGGEPGADACLRGVSEGPEVDAALTAAFGAAGTPTPAVAPDPDLVEAVEAVLRQLVRAVDDDRRTGPLSVLAWLAWWRGDGALADLLVEKLLAAAPEHTLGQLLRTAIDRCVPPPWVGDATTRAHAELMRAAAEIDDLVNDLGGDLDDFGG